MYEAPLVSVGIVTYNHKDFIHECLDSVLAQDYPNIEILVADDGSIDGTSETVAEYARDHPGIIRAFISPKNRGITRNADVLHRHYRGRYVALVDGDDLILPEKISTQAGYMQAHPKCTLSYHNCEIFDSDTRKVIGYQQRSGDAPQGDVGTMLVRGLFNSSPSTMARRDMLPKSGFDERIRNSPDWLYWMETLANGGEIHYIDEVLGMYRRHGSNITVTEPASRMLYEKMLSAFIITCKNPVLIRHSPAMAADILLRLVHNTIFTPKGMVLIEGRSMLRAYESPK